MISLSPSPAHAAVPLLAAKSLLAGGTLLFVAGVMARGGARSCLFVAACAGGLLNGITTKMTTFRVSHVTGTVTDMGLLMGKGLGASLDAASALKLRDLTVFMSTWLLGGAGAFYLSTMMSVGKVISLASLPIIALGLKGFYCPNAKTPWKL